MLLNWMGRKVYHVFANSLIFAEPEHRERLDEVIKAFDVYFKPTSSMIHAWYKLGSLYSNNCKSHSDFMSKLCKLSNGCKFTYPKEIIKFMFLTHNIHKRVQEQLLKEVTKVMSISNVLNIAWKVEAIIQSKCYGQNLYNGKASQNVKVKDIKHRSLSRSDRKHCGWGDGGCCSHCSQSEGKKCSNCATSHLPKWCPGYSQLCFSCNKTGHCGQCCHSNQQNNAQGCRGWLQGGKIKNQWCW